MGWERGGNQKLQIDSEFVVEDTISYGKQHSRGVVRKKYSLLSCWVGVAFEGCFSLVLKEQFSKFKTELIIMIFFSNYIK